MRQILGDLIILLIGITIGIMGEWLIPEKYHTFIGNGCLKDVNNNIVYIPSLNIYDSKQDIYPVMFGGSAMPLAPSYKYFYYILSKQVEKLNSKECNKLVEKIRESNQKNSLQLCESYCGSKGEDFSEVKQMSYGLCTCNNKEGRRATSSYHYCLNNKCDLENY